MSTTDPRWSAETENGLTQMLAEEFVVSTTGSRDPNRVAARAVLDWMAHRGLLVVEVGGQAPNYEADLYHLAELVNGFVYQGDRLNAVVQTARVLRANPRLATRLLFGERSRPQTTGGLDVLAEVPPPKASPTVGPPPDFDD